MIDISKALKISKDNTSQTRIMSNTLRRSFMSSRISRDKIFRREVKIQKLREDTFRSLKNTLQDREKSGGVGGILGTALGLGGAGGLARRFGGRGGGGGGLRGGGGAPKLPRGPLAKSLSKFGRIGPMAIATTGLDFFLRKQQGQSNIQAGGGALSGLGGFAGGAKIGATLGSFVAPGVGTAVGGLLGGAIGGLVGGNLFDRLYGQNIIRAGSDLRRVREEELQRQSKTLFGENLDKFEVVLEKFEKIAPGLATSKEKQDQIVARLSKSTTGTKFPIGQLISVAFDLASIVVPKAQILKLSTKLKLAQKSKVVLQKKNVQLIDELVNTVNQRNASIVAKNKLQERIAAFLKSKKMNLNNKGFREFSKKVSRTFSKEGQALLRSNLVKVDIKKVIGDTDFYLQSIRKVVKGTKDPELLSKALKSTEVFGTGLQKNINRLVKEGADPRLIQAYKKQLRRVYMQQLRYTKKLTKIRNKQTIEQNVDKVISAGEKILFKKGAGTKGQKDLADAISRVINANDPLAIKFNKKELEALVRFRQNYKELVSRGKIEPNETMNEFFKQVLDNVSGNRDINFQNLEKIFKDSDDFLKILRQFDMRKGGSEGGEFIAKGPDTGYIQPMKLHGKERVQIVPEDNRFTRSRAQSTKNNIVMVNTGGGSNRRGANAPQMKSNGTQFVPIIQEASAFDMASKYSQMIASITV